MPEYKLMGAVALAAAALCMPAFSGNKVKEWVIAPTQKAIRPFSKNAVKITDENNRQWLLDKDGHKIFVASVMNGFNTSYDSITPLTGGYALLLNYDFSKKGWRINGLYNDKEQIIVNINPKDKYYLSDNAFFSEGFMPVRKDNKKLGYINKKGFASSKFTYEVANPYSCGKAVVSKDRKNYVYLDEQGKENSIAPAAGKNFSMCSTFVEGKAYVVNGQGQAFIIDERLMPVSPTPPTEITLSREGVNLAAAPDVDLGQADKEELCEGFKIVTTPTGIGITHELPDTLSVSLRLSENALTADSLENIVIKHNVGIGYRDKISVTDSKDKELLFSKIGEDEIEFANVKGRKVRFRVIGDFGLLRADTIMDTPSTLAMKNNNEKEADTGVSIAVSPMSVTANDKRQGVVAVKVTNTSAQSQDLSVVLSGTGMAGGGTFKVKLAAGKSKTYYVTFTKIVKKELRTLSVSAGGKKVVKSIQVVPKAVKL